MPPIDRYCLYYLFQSSTRNPCKNRKQCSAGESIRNFRGPLVHAGPELALTSTLNMRDLHAKTNQIRPTGRISDQRSLEVKWHATSMDPAIVQKKRWWIWIFARQLFIMSRRLTKPSLGCLHFVCPCILKL